MRNKPKLVVLVAALLATTAVAGVNARAMAAGEADATSTSTPPVGVNATTSVGTCHGLTGLASVKSDYVDPNDDLPAGLVANIPNAGDNHDVRISIKGVAGADGSFGTCTFSGDNTPGAGSYTVAKWTALLVSPATDCLTDSDAQEYPLNGKTTIQFTDGSRTQTYSQTTFGAGASDDVLTQSGVVTKGNGLGALFDNQMIYAPITKVAGQLGTDPKISPYPGYEYDTTTAAACAGAPSTTADARDLIVGDGTSGLTGHTAVGYAFQVGH